MAAARQRNVGGSLAAARQQWQLQWQWQQRDSAPARHHVGERRTSEMLKILPDIEILPNTRNVTVCRNTTKKKRVRFAEPTKQDQVPRVQNGIIPLD